MISNSSPKSYTYHVLPLQRQHSTIVALFILPHLFIHPIVSHQRCLSTASLLVVCLEYPPFISGNAGESTH